MSGEITDILPGEEAGLKSVSFFIKGEYIIKIIKKWPAHWEAYYLMGLLLFNTNEKMAIDYFGTSALLGQDL